MPRSNYLLDVIAPARKDEDKMDRALQRAAGGAYQTGAPGFTSQQAVTDIALANGGYGPCGIPDEFGRCASRYHQLGCAHRVHVDWLASAPPRETYEASLANALGGIELAGPKRYVHGWIKALGAGSATEAVAAGAGMPLGLRPHQQRVYRAMRGMGHPRNRALAVARRASAAIGRALGASEATRIFNQANLPAAVWSDADDPDDAPVMVPQATVELAHSLADVWGLLDEDVSAFQAAPGCADLLQPQPGLADTDPYYALASGGRPGRAAAACGRVSRRAPAGGRLGAGTSGQLVTVYLTNGTRTSQGPGPGPKQLPAAEANALVAAKYAIYGDQPPGDVAYQPAVLTTRLRPTARRR